MVEHLNQSLADCGFSTHMNRASEEASRWKSEHPSESLIEDLRIMNRYDNDFCGPHAEGRVETPIGALEYFEYILFNSINRCF